MEVVIDKISNALIRILSWFKNPELIPPIDDGVEIQAVEKDYDQALDETKNFPQNLSELLDHLEETFDSYKMPTAISNLSADSRLGLKKLGAHVPNPWHMPWSDNCDDIKVNVKNGMPSMFFISTPMNKHNKNERVNPSFMFAIKHRKLPWNVEKKSGTPYQFGITFRDFKLFWLTAWIVVKADGSIEVCKEHQYKSIPVVVNGKFKARYEKKIFGDPELIADYKSEGKQGDLIVKNAFRASFDWWSGRQERWSVAVKKNGERITFAVDKSLTKKYFADRDKTVKTLSGRNKKIVHFVKAHDRNYSGKISKVKEHIRGLNSFSWKGYQCLVSAPEFQGLVTSECDVSAIESVDEYKNDYIATSLVGLRLAAAEERMSIR
jgi:hypothetical protein